MGSRSPPRTSATKIGSVVWNSRTAQARSINRNKGPQVNMHKKELNGVRKNKTKGAKVPTHSRPQSLKRDAVSLLVFQA